MIFVLLIMISSLLLVAGVVLTHLGMEGTSLSDLKQDIAVAVGLSIGILSGASLLIFTAGYVVVHMDHFKQQTLLERQVEYETIRIALSKGNYSEVLAHDISEYNKRVLTAREWLDNPLLQDLEFEFYNDLPLIEEDDWNGATTEKTWAWETS